MAMKRASEEWHKILSPRQYAVLREKATEAPFSGKLLYNRQSGSYVCAACSAELFSSDAKFDTDCGWPSFNNVVDSKAVILKEDRLEGLQRVEVICRSCGSHLGHVFQDAPDQPTGLRFCINSVALDFKAAKKLKKPKKEG